MTTNLIGVITGVLILGPMIIALSWWFIKEIKKGRWK